MPVKPRGPRCKKLLKSGNLCDKKEGHSGKHQGPVEDRIERAREWFRANPERTTWLGAKQRAKLKGVPFTIVFEDLPPVPTICPVLGIPLSRSERQPTDNSPSLDRIIPEVGYTPDNIRWISHRANTLKTNATVDEMRLILADLERIAA